MSEPGRSEPWFPKWMLALAGVLLVGIVLYELRGVLSPIFFAFLIAYMLDPVVDKFEARGIPRSVGIAVMLTLVLGVCGLLIFLALPGVVRDLRLFIDELPGTIESMIARASPWIAEMGIELPSTIDEVLANLRLDTRVLAQKAVAPAGAALKWIVGGTASLMGTIVGLLMIPVFAAYLLHDFDRITAKVRELAPIRWRAQVVEVAREVDEVLGAFIRGQLIVMLILAVLYSLGYWLVGVRLAILIGVIAGLVSFIPYVGGAVALLLALVMVAVDWSGWSQLMWVLVVYTVIQLFESFFITPKIVGDKVGLSAIWVLFALMVGGEVFGFMGILLALPAAAVAKIFVLRAVAWYRQSEIFLGPDGSREKLIPGMLKVEGLHESTAGTKGPSAAAPTPPEPEPEPAPEPEPDAKGTETETTETV
jgi:predicted PurR-regulated permease PerM